MTGGAKLEICATALSNRLLIVLSGLLSCWLTRAWATVPTALIERHHWVPGRETPIVRLSRSVILQAYLSRRFHVALAASSLQSADAAPRRTQSHPRSAFPLKLASNPRSSKQKQQENAFSEVTESSQNKKRVAVTSPLAIFLPLCERPYSARLATIAELSRQNTCTIPC